MVIKSKTCKRRIRRLKCKHIRNKSKSWTILHTNIRGFDSKVDSLKAIIGHVDPNVVTINETMFKNDRKLELEGFQSFTSSRDCKDGGGVATCIKLSESKGTLQTFEGKDDLELIITRHSQFKTPINVINFYGAVESRAKKEDINSRWHSIQQQIAKIEANGELLVLIGDFNAHVGELVPGNHSFKSVGGELLCEFLANNNNYILVNSTSKAKGGPFTRIDPSDPQKKSTLDLCIVSIELFPFITSMVIDEARNFTPFRPVSKKKVTYSDHCAIRLTFKDLLVNTTQPQKGQSTIRWNTNRLNGWKTYQAMTTDNSVLDDIASREDLDANKLMNKLDKETTAIKFKAFGKVKVKQKLSLDKEVVSLQTEREEILAETDCSERHRKLQLVEEKMSACMLSKQRDTLVREIKYLRDTRAQKGKVAAIFRVKERVLGSKKANPSAVSLIDPVSSKEINTVQGIKEVTLSYCSSLLTNRKPSEEFEPDIDFKVSLHKVRMHSHTDSNYELPDDLFDSTFSELSKKPGTKYDFITKAGPSMKSALRNVCKTAWRSEILPEKWSQSTLFQIYKGSGAVNELKNYRFIHMKSDFSKFFGHLVMNKAKGELVSNMSKFQIGTKPGHRAQEHIFALKCVISFHFQCDKPLILSTWDVKKFFDSENLIDCMNEVYRNNVRGKLYRLIYKMNENTCIRVQTPVGISEEQSAGETVGQGTVEGAILSAVNLDNGVRDFFTGSEAEVTFGDISLGPVLFQDDIARLALTVSSAQAGNMKMESVAATKLLDFNIDKSCYIVIGRNKRRQELIKQLDENPLELCGNKMKENDSIKYLGDYISCKGLKDSISVTVARRKGVVAKASYEIKSVVEDFRSHTVGGLMAGLDLWEMAVIPMIMYNAETWQEIDTATVKALENMQFEFLRCLFAVGSGCPLPILLSETGSILMELRILQKKVLFLHHLEHLEDGSLAKEVYRSQTRMGLTGILSECSDFLARFGLHDLHGFSKVHFKKLVKEKIRILNKEKIIDLVKKKQYKKVKIETLNSDDFTRKEYLSNLNVSDARIKFRLSSNMLQTVKMNFQSDPSFRDSLWSCNDCGKIDTQQHLLYCEGYKIYRQGKDLDNDADLVRYVKSILQHRLDDL